MGGSWALQWGDAMLKLDAHFGSWTLVAVVVCLWVSPDERWWEGREMCSGKAINRRVLFELQIYDYGSCLRTSECWLILFCIRNGNPIGNSRLRVCGKLE
ncbi:hypothetical protein V6N12_074496 [Hibiscus sabdariffa]|uniref:Secreted protein n=1 Tax=Hibiscus sabdariffa TaxID=183260 RepID=A0ABR2AHS1_9ROSI